MMDVSTLVNTGNSAGQLDIYIPGDTVSVRYQTNKKSYNSRWESDPLLKTWITRHPTDNGKVVCQFCQSVIRAHKNDLLEHTRTLKHQRNFMANSTPQDYNEFVICLNELRKDAQVMTNGVKRKRSSKSSSSNNNNTMLALPAPSSSNSNNNCIISTNNNSLSLNNNIMHISNWTTMTNGALNNNNNNNCKDNNDDDEDEEDDDDNGMNTTDITNDVDLWPENNHETYISANSPSDLVSVILTETEEQAGSPNANSNSSCSVSLSSSLPPTLTPIINSNNSNIPPSASPLHHHTQQQHHTVQQARLLKQESTSSSCPTSSVQGLSYTVTSCSITSADVISAIQENYFNLSELVEISKSAIEAIGQSINPPALIINPPTIVSSQVSSKRDSKRKSKKNKGDKNRKKIKAMKQEGVTFQMGLETL